MTVDEAETLFCPIYQGACKAGKCMAWRSDIDEELDIAKTNEIATLEERISGQYSNPIFKQSKNEGWCKLIDKDY